MSDPGAVSRPPPADPAVSLSGLTEDQARSFHKLFVVSFLLFLGIAIVAHVLVWQWRPWIPGSPGYPAAVNSTASANR